MVHTPSSDNSSFLALTFPTNSLRNAVRFSFMKILLVWTRFAAVASVMHWQNVHFFILTKTESAKKLALLEEDTWCLSSKARTRTTAIWKGLVSAILYDQNKHNESKHFCQRCLRGYQRRELLERQKCECEGLLKRPTKTDLPKVEENKMFFHKLL